ncbi:MAG: SDR family oxidoreductase [Pseudomonadales bacterium]
MTISDNKPWAFSEGLFAEKVFVVTGGGQGIGKAISAMLRALSATVVVLEHPQFTADLVEADILSIDLSDQQALNKCMPRIINDYGRCDGLINNARAGQRTVPLQETAKNIGDSIDVGLTAPTLLSQQLIHYAEKHPDIPRSIINISSTSARNVSSESASYHTTKAALESLTRYLAVYAGEYNVRVNAIAPGFIVKDEHRERFNDCSNGHYRSMALAAHSLERIGSVDDVANTVVFLLSNASLFITGQTLVVDGGLTLKDGFANAMSVNPLRKNTDGDGHQ